jgi:hypothetical protein
MNGSPESWSLQQSAVHGELQRFIAEKKAFALAAAQTDGKALLPEFQSLFAAADDGDCEAVRGIYTGLHQRLTQRDRTIIEEYEAGTRWSVVFEVASVLGYFGAADEKYSVAFGRDTIASIAPGSIYFGGTDAGRWVITALANSHVNGDPFFTLTQNGMASLSYMRYVRAMYANRIYVPTDAEVTGAFDDYVTDAQQRQREGKLKPGEFLEEVDGKVQVTGEAGVMAINGVLTKLMFDRNPDREFYIEESFPLEWMYPHLSPNGLILKINRAALPEIPQDLVQQDRDYWKRYVRPLIGDWLTNDTSVAEVAAFVDRAHLRGELSGLDADSQFVASPGAQRIFSKLRSALGGIYSWRARNTQNSAVKQRMMDEADFAFRQAWALCPRSPEAVFRYINSLIEQRRFDDAIIVAETAAKADPREPNFANLLDAVQKMKLRR